MSKVFFNILLILGPCLISAQVAVSGYVTNEDKEPIIGAHIKSSLGKIAVTNAYGFYVIYVESGKVHLAYSHIGYSSHSHVHTVRGDTSIDIRLEPLTLDAVAVTDEIVHRDVRDRMRLGSVALPIETLNAVPSLLGERDVIKGLAILPGVQSGLEGSSGLFIRGGTPDQNLLLLDNAPVYNASHLYGLTTVFNPDVVKNVELHKGNIPARYGDRLSSVISVNLKEGNLKKWNKKYSMGLIGSSFSFDGPIKEDKTGLMIAGRATYLSLISLPVRIAYETSPGFSDFADYNMYDINAKLNHTISDHEKIFVNFYAGNDHRVGLTSLSSKGVRTKSTSGYNWGNITFSLRKTKSHRKNWFSEDQILYTRFKTNLFGRQAVIENLDRNATIKKRFSLLHEYSYQKQWSHWTSSGHWLKGGLDLSYRKAVPIKTAHRSSLMDIAISTPIKRVVDGYKAAIFVEDNWAISDRLVLDAGLRYQFYYTQNKSYRSVEPRFNIGYALSDRLVLSSAYGRTSQSIHGLPGVNEGLPIHGWVNASKLTPMQLADLFSTGVGYIGKSLDIRFDGYYRLLHDQVDFRQGTGLLTGFNVDYEDQVEKNGKGWAYGMEFYLNKRSPKLTYIFSYTLGFSERQFPRISQGARYFHQYDQRHNLTLFANWKISKKWTVAGLFQYNTGRRQTLPIAAFQEPGGFQNIFYAPNRNNFVMPDYHRLDLSFTKHWVSKKKERNKSLTFSVYNAYFRKNVSYYRLDESTIFDAGRRVTGIKYDLKQVTILPILPSITYTVDLTSRK